VNSSNSVFVICAILFILIPANVEAQNFTSFAKEILPLNNNLHQGILVAIGVLVPGIIIIIVIEWIGLRKQKVPQVKDKTEINHDQRTETVDKSTQTKYDDEWKGI